MADKRKAAVFAVLALAVLVGGCVLASMFPRLEIALAAAGFAGYVLCGRRAMVLWRTDERVFDHPRRFPDHHGNPPARMFAAGLFLAALAASALAQQTIFNVPSADVLDPGKVYLEVDELFRPTDPKFSSTTVRGVIGVVPRMEAGVNFGGLVSPGPVVPTATVALKLQPVRAGDFAVTAGGYGLFYVRGSEDGNPAGMGYGFVSYRLPKLGTRIEVGGWYASAGFVHPPHQLFGSSTGGALATIEQPLPWVKGLTLAADWWSGENAIGYASPGLIYTFGHWTAYAAYSIKNGDSKGNGGLIELGYAF
jgi:hypothetical protein